MREADRAQLLDLVHGGTRDFVDTLAGLSDLEAVWKPEGGWSAVELAEHLILSEQAMIEWIGSGKPDAERPDADPAQDERWIKGAVYSSRRAQAPEGSLPTGRFTSKAGAIEAFHRRRAATVECILEYKEDPRKLHTTHAVLGPISCWACFLVIALHPSRHARQIRERQAPQLQNK